MKLIWSGKIQGCLSITMLALVVLLGVTASQARTQDDANTFSKDVPEQTMTFSTVNPYTRISGSMTIVFAGVFYATRTSESAGSEISRITGRQQGTFSFVPDDSSQPTISGRFHFKLAGQPQPHSDGLEFAFRMTGKAPDGSMFTFVQSERAVISEGGVVISFGKTDGVEAQ